MSINYVKTVAIERYLQEQLANFYTHCSPNLMNKINYSLLQNI